MRVADTPSLGHTPAGPSDPPSNSRRPSPPRPECQPPVRRSRRPPCSAQPALPQGPGAPVRRTAPRLGSHATTGSIACDAPLFTVPHLHPTRARPRSRLSGLSDLPRGACPPRRPPPRRPCATRPLCLHPLHTPPCPMLFPATSRVGTWPKTGLQVLAVVLQKAATGRPGNSSSPPGPEAPWRIAAPATTRTPSTACDPRCISCTRVAHHRTWAHAPPVNGGSFPRTPATHVPCDPRTQTPAAGAWQSSPVWRWRRSPMPVPRAPRAPIPKREFSKLALSTAPPSPQARFVAGGPPQHWNQRSLPGACWRLLAAARLPRPCRLNSPSVSPCDNVLFLYTSYTVPRDLPNACPAGGASRGALPPRHAFRFSLYTTLIGRHLRWLVGAVSRGLSSVKPVRQGDAIRLARRHSTRLTMATIDHAVVGRRNGSPSRVHP